MTTRDDLVSLGGTLVGAGELYNNFRRDAEMNYQALV